MTLCIHSFSAFKYSKQLLSPAQMGTWCWTGKGSKWEWEWFHGNGKNNSHTRTPLAIRPNIVERDEGYTKAKQTSYIRWFGAPNFWPKVTPMNRGV